jgi:hypothetical protein
MSFNGSGTFLINSSGQPVVTNTVISSTAFNALTADLGTGLSTTITKDGQTTATAKIPFALGLSAAAASNLAAGTVAAPGLYLATDTGTGLYRIGANNYGVAVSGAKVLDISATGLGVTGTMLVGGLAITPAEGTWTPIDSSGASLSLTSALGKYKKVGSIVWFSFQCAYPVTASAAAATIGGLPFTAANTGPDNVTATMQTNGSTAAASSVNQNASTISLQIASTSVQFTNAQLSTLFIRSSGFYFTT